MDLPNTHERRELIRLYGRKYLNVDINGNLLENLVNLTEGFASSDIEASMRNITYKLIADKSLKLTSTMLIDELSRVVSISKTNPEKIKAIRDWCKDRAVAASKQ